MRDSTPSVRPSSPRGFTLVELLVVIGIIGVLVSLLLPTLAKARRQSEMVRCQAQMKQIGDQMIIYMNANSGWLFPPMLGVNVPAPDRWTTNVFKFIKIPDPPTEDPADYMPKYMLCPSDSTDVIVQPDGTSFVRPGQLNIHTYVVSHIVGADLVRYSKRDLKGLTPSEYIVMGEKNSAAPDYYMGTRFGQPSDYNRVVNFVMHGRQVGSNYLHLDMHVETRQKTSALKGIDPELFRTIE